METLFILIVLGAGVIFVSGRSRPRRRPRTGIRPYLVRGPEDQPAQPMPAAGSTIRGRCWVIDGDTIAIGEIRIRLAGIDAPELDHPYGRNAKGALIGLCRGQIVTATVTGDLSHDRVVARCALPDGRDLAAELVAMGLALDWSKFSGGCYRHLEPGDARRKLWRADARQKGRFPPGGPAR